MGNKFLKYYEYDKKLPLNPVKVKVKESKNYVVYKIYYYSINNVKVPALLIKPKIFTPPYPCIIFLHGYGGRKEDVLSFADLPVSYSYALFSIDAQYHGERSAPGKVLYSPNLQELKENVIQTIVDLRRGVDFLETNPEIDSNRIGYAGGSMGGMLGAIFIGVEPRIKAAVLTVGGGNLPLMIKLSKHYSVPPIREAIKKSGISEEELKKTLDPVDPINFIGLFSPRPVQIHCGRYDKIVPAETQKLLAETAKEPKEVYWYDAGHSLPLEIVLKRALEFFENNLKKIK